MARTSRVDVSVAGARAHAKRLTNIAKKVEQVLDRSKATVMRRVGPEASRLISKDVLNLTPRRISPHIRVSSTRVKGGEFIVVSASRTRLPLVDFTPRFSKRDGVTVTTWREQGPKHYPHAFKRRDRKGVWQRAPYSGGKDVSGRGTQRRAGPSGLVHRLPILERKGPSMHRVFQFSGPNAGHGDIRPDLTAFIQKRLSEEITRLLSVARRP